jgi:hypothetical protein
MGAYSGLPDHSTIWRSGLRHETREGKFAKPKLWKAHYLMDGTFSGENKRGRTLIIIYCADATLNLVYQRNHKLQPESSNRV